MSLADALGKCARQSPSSTAHRSAFQTARAPSPAGTAHTGRLTRAVEEWRTPYRFCPLAMARYQVARRRAGQKEEVWPASSRRYRRQPCTGRLGNRPPSWGAHGASRLASSLTASHDRSRGWGKRTRLFRVCRLAAGRRAPVPSGSPRLDARSRSARRTARILSQESHCVKWKDRLSRHDGFAAANGHPSIRYSACGFHQRPIHAVHQFIDGAADQ